MPDLGVAHLARRVRDQAAVQEFADLRETALHVHADFCFRKTDEHSRELEEKPLELQPAKEGMRGTLLSREIPDDALQPAIRQAAGQQLAVKGRSVLAPEAPDVADNVSRRQAPELFGQLRKLRPGKDVPIVVRQRGGPSGRSPRSARS